MPTMTPAVLAEGANTLTYAAAAADDALDGSAQEITGKPVILHVKTGATGTTVTIAPNSASFQTPGAGLVSKASISVVMAANSERFIEVTPIGIYKNLTTGLIPVAYTSLTTVTRAAFAV